MAGSLSRFIENVNNNGGFSLSNNFDVEFTLPDTLTDRMKTYGIEFGNDSSTGTTLKLLCEEAQLPNIQAATGEISGRFLGEGLVKYPHTKVYNDFQLGWMGDANLLSLKFLNLWYGYIFDEYEGDSGSVQIPAGSNFTNRSLSQVKNEAGKRVDAGRTTRLNYPEDYLSTIIITKTDRNNAAANGQAPIAYTMIDAYPYSIDAVPMSYGASQIVKVTANFYYSKHLVTYNKIKN